MLALISCIIRGNKNVEVGKVGEEKVADDNCPLDIKSQELENEVCEIQLAVVAPADSRVNRDFDISESSWTL